MTHLLKQSAITLAFTMPMFTVSNEAQTIEKGKEFQSPAPAVTFARIFPAGAQWPLFAFLDATEKPIFTPYLETGDGMRTLVAESANKEGVNRKLEYKNFCFFFNIGDKFGALDILGNVIVPFAYKSIQKAQESEEWLAAVNGKLKDNAEGYDQTIKKLSTRRDSVNYERTFNTYIENMKKAHTASYSEYRVFKRGDAVLNRTKVKNNYGIMDKYENYVIDNNYASIWLTPSDINGELNGDKPSNQLFPVKKSASGNWQFVDYLGTTIRDEQTDNMILDSLTYEDGSDQHKYVVKCMAPDSVYSISETSGIIDIADFFQNYVSLNMKHWQEMNYAFETPEQFEVRMDEIYKAKAINYFANCAINLYNSLFPNREVFEIHDYDKSNHSFRLTSNIGNINIHVPENESNDFIHAYNQKNITCVSVAYSSKDNAIELSEIAIKINNTDKVYTGNNKINYVLYTTDDKVIAQNISIGIGGQSREKVRKIDNKVSDIDRNIPICETRPAIADSTYVLIIANENYKYVSNPRYTVHDGDIFKKYCESTLGIPEANIKYYANAATGDIRRGLKWLKGLQTEFSGNPNIIFYYSGHGMADINNEGTSYIMPIDASQDDIESAIQLNQIYADLSSNRGKVTCVIDACFSGLGRGAEDGETVGHKGFSIKAKPAEAQGNMVIFSAAQGEEKAYPYDDKSHGLFTYFFLKKLQETKGEVNYKELSDYVKTSVQDYLIKSGKEVQHPDVTSKLDNTEWEQWNFGFRKPEPVMDPLQQSQDSESSPTIEETEETETNNNKLQ